MTLTRTAKIVLASLLACTAGLAVSATQNLTVSASVSAVCSFTTAARTLSFALDPSVGGAISGTLSGTVQYKCTNGTAIGTASGGNGLNHDGTTRRVSDGTNSIPYSLTVTSGGAGQGFSSGKDRTLSVTGSIAAADYLDAVAGTYTDTVVLTVSP